MTFLLLLLPALWFAAALLLARVGTRSVLGTVDGSAFPSQASVAPAFRGL